MNTYTVDSCHTVWLPHVVCFLLQQHLQRTACTACAPTTASTTSYEQTRVHTHVALQRKHTLLNQNSPPHQQMRTTLLQPQAARGCSWTLHLMTVQHTTMQRQTQVVTGAQPHELHLCHKPIAWMHCAARQPAQYQCPPFATMACLSTQKVHGPAGWWQ